MTNTSTAFATLRSELHTSEPRRVCTLFGDVNASSRTPKTRAFEKRFFPRREFFRLAPLLRPTRCARISASACSSPVVLKYDVAPCEIVQPFGKASNHSLVSLSNGGFRGARFNQKSTKLPTFSPGPQRSWDAFAPGDLSSSAREIGASGCLNISALRNSGRYVSHESPSAIALRCHACGGEY